jgi:hypothetical protein
MPFGRQCIGPTGETDEGRNITLGYAGISSSSSAPGFAGGGSGFSQARILSAISSVTSLRLVLPG